MTEPWKPQPGKPAMTRDEKTLVTDLVDAGANWVWSESMDKYWTPLGYIYTDRVERPRDLIKPTAAILAAHDIDADGKPVVKADEAAESLKNKHVIHGTTEERIMGRFYVFKDTAPEEDESWESWYHAALDMLQEEVREILRSSPIGPQPARIIYGEKWLKPSPEGAKREGR